MDIILRGVLSCESHHHGAWRRVIFYGEPADDDGSGSGHINEQPDAGGGSSGGGGSMNPCDEGAVPASGVQALQLAACSLPAVCDSPKSVPDFESAGACWVSLEQLEQVPVRSASEMVWFWRLGAEGLQVPPLALPGKWADVFQDVEF